MRTKNGNLEAIVKSFKTLNFRKYLYTQSNHKNNRAIFSFTFDDVPISAARNGAKILEEFNITGTYSVALGMEHISDDDSPNDRQFIDATDIKSLHKAGHDVGCHTYSHLNLRRNKTELIVSDCKKNTKKLQEILQTSSIDHFSYPFGAVSPGGKKNWGVNIKHYAPLTTE